LSTSFPFYNYRVRFSSHTDIGKTHDHNEDSFYLPSSFPLGIVADGMGGHASGEVASKMAVEAVSEYFTNTEKAWNPIWPLVLDPIRKNMHRMETSVSYSNAVVHAKSLIDPDCKKMGTTICAAYFEDDYCVICHVGDSRIYRIRKDNMDLLMEDHSFVNDISRMKHISFQEAASSGKTNVVSRVIGPNPQVTVDVAIIYPKIGDVFILCSDGLNDMISDENIAEIVNSTEDLDEMCEALVDAANDAGGKDNITVVAARIEVEND
jgi:PPM family protein phosphatase